MTYATASLRFHDALAGRGGAVGGAGVSLGLGVLLTMAYGAVMGSFGWVNDGSAWNVLFSAIKAPLLLGVTFGLTLPSFVVINTLLGLRRDLPDVLDALVSTQLVVAIVLLSLAPLTLFWYVAVPHYRVAILFNAAVFGLASLAAQKPLRRRYAKLIARDRRHGLLLRVWIGVYAFVGIQMGWVLRPFIGEPGLAPAFLRPEKWDNAYVIVFRMIWRVLSG